MLFNPRIKKRRRNELLRLNAGVCMFFLYRSVSSSSYCLKAVTKLIWFPQLYTIVWFPANANVIYGGFWWDIPPLFLWFYPCLRLFYVLTGARDNPKRWQSWMTSSCVIFEKSPSGFFSLSTSTAVCSWHSLRWLTTFFNET